MCDYYCMRVWQLKPGASASEVEHLASSGVLEMQRWIPGVKRVSLLRVTGSEPKRYPMAMTFADEASYRRWRQVEEGPDYWERFASISMRW